MKTLPGHVERYGGTPEFSEKSIPACLLRSHSTKAGIWGKIVAIEGRLRCQILEPEVEEIELSPARPGIMEPEVSREVETVGPVRFRVDFYRRSGSARRPSGEGLLQVCDELVRALDADGKAEQVRRHGA